MNENDAEFEEKLRNPNNAKRADVFMALLGLSVLLVLYAIWEPLIILGGFLLLLGFLKLPPDE